jgi:hypothetical protein
MDETYLDRLEQIARNEATFREVNEAIAQTAKRLDADEVDFVCECGDADCAERITAGLREYNRVRRHPTRFLLTHGHEQPGIEQVVRRTHDYTVVEKVERTVAHVARLLNPRPETA